MKVHVHVIVRDSEEFGGITRAESSRSLRVPGVPVRLDTADRDDIFEVRSEFNKMMDEITKEVHTALDIEEDRKRKAEEALKQTQQEGQ